MDVPNDILYHISEFLLPREMFTIKTCNKYLNNTFSTDIFWKKRVSSLPKWASGSYMYAKKLKNCRRMNCFMCGEELDRFCALFLCDCVQMNGWMKRYSPRWHPSCVFNTNIRSVGNKRCPICDKLVMYVQITSFP